MQLNKKDLGLSFVIGILAGLFLAFIVYKFKGGTLSQGIIAFVGLVIITPLGYLIGFLLSKRVPTILQFLKFAEVGGLNFVIDLGVLNILMAWQNIYAGPLYPVFKGTSFLIAVTNSYFWNKYWAFKSTGGGQTGEALKFLLTNIVGFGVNVGVASLVVFAGPLGAISVEKWANLGAVIGSLVALTWNFIGIKFFVFKK